MIDPKDESTLSQNTRIKQAISDKIHHRFTSKHPIDSPTQATYPAHFEPPSFEQEQFGYPVDQIDPKTLHEQSLHLDVDQQLPSTWILRNLARKIFDSQTNSNKQHNHLTGVYNGYNYRPDKYASIHGSTCTNFLEYDGIAFGSFVCPIEGFSYDATLCCGPRREQYCCSQAEANEKMVASASKLKWDSNRQSLLLALIIISGCIFLFIILVCCVLVGYKRRTFVYTIVHRDRKNEDIVSTSE